MPTYTYECPLEHYTRIIQHMREPRPTTLLCGTCGKDAVRIFRFNPQNFEPYVTQVGDGKTKVVRNAADERDVESKFGVYDPGPEEWKRMNSPDAMKARRERRQRRTGGRRSAHRGAAAVHRARLLRRRFARHLYAWHQQGDPEAPARLE